MHRRTHRVRPAAVPAVILPIVPIVAIGAIVAIVAIVLGACADPRALSKNGAALPGEGEDAGKIVVYRDTWGVAHIYAPTVEDGLFAQGWAQAEDRPEQLLLNLTMGIGEFASAVGKDGVAVDLRSRLFDHHGAARRGLEELPLAVRGHIEAFAAGIDAYYAAHPEDTPAWFAGRRVDASMVLAFGRLFLYNWSIDEAYGDLRRAGIEPGIDPAQRGSNQFAIAPQRSAEGAAILAIDPHLSWFGPSRFWEFRIHAGELHGSGVTLPGSPYIGLGHNRDLAWAMTTGGPDTADVYELALDPQDPDRYRYDGAWRELARREVTVAVKGEEGQRHTLLFSHHGPIIARHGDRAWAAKISYHDVGASNAAWHELNFARDYTGAVRALEALTMFPQNVMVADTSGNIYYQRTGRVPVRPSGYDWSRPVDGSTSASEWQGIHPASDHLQVLNPPHGYLQNCNIPPDAMMPRSPFSLAGAKQPYLFSSYDHGERLDGWTNQRGARAIELLAADDSVTAEEAMSYINDIHPYGAGRWIEALVLADSKFGAPHAQNAHYATALDGLQKWTGELAAGSSAALVYDYWRHQLAADLERDALRQVEGGIDDWYAIVEGRAPKAIALTDPQLEALARSFAGALDVMVANHGALAAAYGDRYRVGRGNLSWPAEGGGGRVGTTTLRNMTYAQEKDDHTRWGVGGQTSTQVVVLTKPPRSYLYLPLGESDREDSPHFRDQAEKAFSPRRLKETWWLPQDLAGHIGSRAILDRTALERGAAPLAKASG